MVSLIIFFLLDLSRKTIWYFDFMTPIFSALFLFFISSFFFSTPLVPMYFSAGGTISRASRPGSDGTKFTFVLQVSDQLGGFLMVLTPSSSLCHYVPFSSLPFLYTVQFSIESS